MTATPLDGSSRAKGDYDRADARAARRPRDAAHHEALPGDRRERRRQLRPARGRGPRPARRERRRQVDADEHPLRALPRRTRARSCIKGKPVQLGSPSAAIDAGVGMVHQHFMLIPVMTVAENIVLAAEPTTHGVAARPARGRAARRRRSRSASGSRSTPAARIEDITVGPAAARRDPEGALPQRGHPRRSTSRRQCSPRRRRRSCSRSMRGLTARGKSVIFITHKLNEVLEIADRITVLRRGKLVETLPAEGATEASLARLMVGREVLLRVEKTAAKPAEPLLEVEGLQRPRRPRDREGARRLVRGARGRDRRHRGDRRQRPDRADRRADRAAARSTPGRCASTARTSRTTRVHGALRARVSATSRRTASGAGSCSSTRSRRTSRSTTTARSRLAVRLALPAPPDRARPAR